MFSLLIESGTCTRVTDNRVGYTFSVSARMAKQSLFSSFKTEEEATVWLKENRFTPTEDPDSTCCAYWRFHLKTQNESGEIIDNLFTFGDGLYYGALAVRLINTAPVALPQVASLRPFCEYIDGKPNPEYGSNL